MYDIYGFTLGGIYNFFEKKVEIEEQGETPLFHNINLYQGGTVFSNDYEEGYVIPEINKQNLIDEIMFNCAELLTVPQNPYKFKSMVEQFFNTNKHNFDRIWIALWMDYSPIDNYDRHEYQTNEYDSKMVNTDTKLYKEKVEFTPTGSNITTTTPTGSESVTTSPGANSKEITDEYIYGENSSGKSPTTTTERTPVTETQSTTYSDRHDTVNESFSNDRKDTTEKQNYVQSGNTEDKHSGNDYLTIWAHGNVGVAKTSEIIRDEIELRTFNFYNYVSELFENKLLLQIY